MPHHPRDSHAFRRWRYGFGASLYGQAVIIIAQLLGVPILLHYWGSQLYGEWLVVSAVPTYLSMTDLGFSQSAANDMTQKVARHDETGALAVFQSLGALVAGAAALGLCISLAAVALLPFHRWMHFRTISSSDVRVILALLATEILVRLLDGVAHAGYRATGDYALHLAIYYTVFLAQTIAVWAAAAAGLGPVVAAAGILGVRIAATPFIAWLLLRRHPWLSFGIRRANRGTLQELAKPAVANLSMPLAQALNIQGMVLVIATVLGPISVVIFSTLRTLARLAYQAVLTVSNAAEPEFAAAFGAGETGLLGRLYIHVTRLGFWLAAGALVILAFLGSTILEIWTRGHVPMERGVFDLLLLNAVAAAFWYSALTVLKAANLHLRATGLYALASAVSVALAAFLLRSSPRLALVALSLLLIHAAMITYALPAAAKLSGVHPLQGLLSAMDPFPLFAGRMNSSRSG